MNVCTSTRRTNGERKSTAYRGICTSVTIAKVASTPTRVQYGTTSGMTTGLCSKRRKCNASGKQKEEIAASPDGDA